MASDFIFGALLGFARTHHKITRRRKGEHGLGLRELPKVWGFPFNNYTMAEASDLKFCTLLGCAKIHHKITLMENSEHGLGLGELPKILWFHFNIYTMAEAWTSNLVHSLGFPRSTIKPHPKDK